MNKKELIESLRRQGFTEQILKAFSVVPREIFVSPYLKKHVYEDIALPISNGQTISQPYTIAFMLSLLNLQESKNQKILEIGSGSGYVLALISKIDKNAKIYGIEIKKTLAEKSYHILKNNKKIKILSKSGFNGYPEEAPFNRILISASAPSLDILDKLCDQLSDNGILVSPVKFSIYQIKKKKNKIEKKVFPGFVFVPLLKE